MVAGVVAPELAAPGVEGVGVASGDDARSLVGEHVASGCRVRAARPSGHPVTWAAVDGRVLLAALAVAATAAWWWAERQIERRRGRDD